MANAIKRRLKIRSPSQVFVELGRLTLEGLSQGLVAGGESAKKVLESTAQALVDTAKGAFGGANMLSGIIDMDPTITPVLDLSNVERDAKKLGDLTNVVPITAAASFGQASAVSQGVSAAQQASSEATAAGTPTFMFEQNNYSPEALSDVDIYRQTKNQLGQIKNALGVS
jgi:hypothetical protein